MERSSTHAGVGVPDVAFGLLCIVSVAAVLLGQVVSLVVFDSTGLDEYVPSVVIYSSVPAALMTLLPAAVAARRYGRRRALVVAAVVFVAASVASLLTSGFFLLG